MRRRPARAHRLSESRSIQPGERWLAGDCLRSESFAGAPNTLREDSPPRRGPACSEVQGAPTHFTKRIRVLAPSNRSSNARGGDSYQRQAGRAAFVERRNAATRYSGLTRQRL